MPLIRVLHTADLHLGSSFSSFPGQAAGLQADQLEMLARLTKFCAERQIQVLLIAGDLFDQPLPPTKLVNTVASLFASIPETEIFIAAGNHDPAFIDSPYRTFTWPANVHCFTDTLSFVDLSSMPISLPVRVYGTGFTATAAAYPLLPEGVSVAADHRLNLLVLHGELVSGAQNSDYNPVKRDQLAATGLNYTALGHRHAATALLPLGAGYAAYSGCPLGRGFDETGVKSVRYLEFNFPDIVNAPDPTAYQLESELIQFGGRRFVEHIIDSSGCETNQELAEIILNQLKAAENSWQRDCHRIILRGSPDEGLSIEPFLLRQYLDDHLFYLEIIDQTEPSLDLRVLSAENNLRGTFVRLAAERVRQAEMAGEPGEAALAKRALQLGLAAYAGEVKPNANR